MKANLERGQGNWPREKRLQAQAPGRWMGEGREDAGGAGWIALLVGLALVPLLAVTGAAFWRSLSYAAADHSFWKSAEFWFFHLGVLLWMICLAGLGSRALQVIYVFGHEWTHALAALCCGARLLSLPVVSSSGGHVVTDRSNLFIHLAPYVIPIYAVVAGLGFGVAGLVWPLREEVRWALYGILGFTWAFHATFTLRMMRVKQPDFEVGGRFLSLILIGLANLLLLCVLLVLAAPQLSWMTFLQTWLQEFTGVVAGLGQAARGG